MKLLFAAAWLALVIWLDPRTDGGAIRPGVVIETMPVLIALLLYLAETTQHIKDLTNEWRGR